MAIYIWLVGASAMLKCNTYEDFHNIIDQIHDYHPSDNVFIDKNTKQWND